ncbi:hypothetical protein Emag_006317 [Eimeria magna]
MQRPSAHCRYASTAAATAAAAAAAAASFEEASLGNQDGSLSFFNLSNGMQTHLLPPPDATSSNSSSSSSSSSSLMWPASEALKLSSSSSSSEEERDCPLVSAAFHPELPLLLTAHSKRTFYVAEDFDCCSPAAAATAAAAETAAATDCSGVLSRWALGFAFSLFPSICCLSLCRLSLPHPLSPSVAALSSSSSSSSSSSFESAACVCLPTAHAALAAAATVLLLLLLPFKESEGPEAAFLRVAVGAAAAAQNLTADCLEERGSRVCGFEPRIVSLAAAAADRRRSSSSSSSCCSSSSSMSSAVDLISLLMHSFLMATQAAQIGPYPSSSSSSSSNSSSSSCCSRIETAGPIRCLLLPRGSGRGSLSFVSLSSLLLLP